MCSTRRVALCALLLAATACPGAGDRNRGRGGDSLADASLFARLGGMDGVRALVDELAGRIAADERIHHHFARTDFRRFKARLVVQLCAVTGGPCRYRGRSMREVHRNRGIAPSHFDAFVEDLAAALESAQVSARDRSDLLVRMRRMKPDIVP